MSKLYAYVIILFPVAKLIIQKVIFVLGVHAQIVIVLDIE